MDTILQIITAAIIVFNGIKSEMTCETNCTMTYIFKTGDLELVGIKKNQELINYWLFEETIEVEVPVRRYISSIWYQGLSSSLSYSNEGLSIPDEEEFMKWRKISGCYVGVMCPPGGDCWGSDSEICKDHKIQFETPKIPSQSFRWKDAHWTKFLYHTCSMDWECYVTKLKKIVYLEHKDGMVKPYIKMFEKKFTLEEEGNKYYTSMKGNFFIEKNPFKKSGKIKADCFNREGEKICSGSIDGKTFVMEFKRKKWCLFLNGKFESNNQIDYSYESGYTNQVDKAATLDDLISLEETARYTVDGIAYNFQLVTKHLVNTQKILSMIIFNLAKFNPNIISDIVQEPLYNTVKNGRLHVCPCETRDVLPDCIFGNEINKHSLETCGKRIGKDKEIHLFDDEKFNKVDLLGLEYRGKGETIFEKEEEKQYFKETKYTIEEQANEHWIVSPYQMVWDKSTQLFHTLGAVGGCVYIVSIMFRFFKPIVGS